MSSSPPPPKLLRVQQVPDYIETRHGRKFTRQTVYNWINLGRKGQVLRTKKLVGTTVTTEGWVDEFISTL